MTDQSDKPEGIRLTFAGQAYDRLLRAARRASEEALERLRALQGRYPADLPRPCIDRLQEFHARTPDGWRAPEGGERRGAPRFVSAAGKAALSELDRPEEVYEVQV